MLQKVLQRASNHAKQSNSRRHDTVVILSMENSKNARLEMPTTPSLCCGNVNAEQKKSFRNSLAQPSVLTPSLTPWGNFSVWTVDVREAGLQLRFRIHCSAKRSSLSPVSQLGPRSDFKVSIFCRYSSVFDSTPWGDATGDSSSSEAPRILGEGVGVVNAVSRVGRWRVTVGTCVVGAVW